MVTYVSIILFFSSSVLTVSLAHSTNHSLGKNSFTFSSSSAKYDNHWRHSRFQESNFTESIKRNRIKFVADSYSVQLKCELYFSSFFAIASLFGTIFHIILSFLNILQLAIPPPLV